MSKHEISRNFNYKGGKKETIPLYSRNYVNEEGGHKNRKVGLEPRLVHVKETTHDMLNMPMNELHPIWPLKQLLCPQELIELKVIKHRYHMWKDYSKRDNERIAKWNVRTREVHEKEICNRVIVAKQGMPKDFWFNLYIGKFSAEKLVEEYVQKQCASQSTALDK
jgi:hypothetical protein